MNAAVSPRIRMTREERMEQIVKGATSFFAEHGINGQTRDLAVTLGITHALLYRYFPSKKALIERVYHDVFLGRWDDAWSARLSDDSLSFAKRLAGFYTSYAAMILTKEAVRIFVYSGLSQSSIPQRFLTRIQRRVFLPLLGAMRSELGLPSLAVCPATEVERELLWHLHGSIFYIGIRHWVYGLPLPLNLEAAVALRTESYLLSAPTLVKAAVLAATSRPVRRSTRSNPD